MEIIMNKDNLKDEEVTGFSVKVRGIIEKDGSFVVGKYDDVYLLPGGKVEEGEDLFLGLRRELKEELGVDYSSDEMIPFIRVIHYDKDYIKRDGSKVNRKVDTMYYIVSYKGFDLDKVTLSESERKYGFSLGLLSSADLEDISKMSSVNPRREFFNSELSVVLNNYLSKESYKVFEKKYIIC